MLTFSSSLMLNVNILSCWYSSKMILLWMLFALIMAACISDYIIFLSCSLFFFSSANLSRRRLDVYHTSTHGLALVQI